jgi:hypothetical protein
VVAAWLFDGAFTIPIGVSVGAATLVAGAVMLLFASQLHVGDRHLLVGTLVPTVIGFAVLGHSEMLFWIAVVLGMFVFVFRLAGSGKGSAAGTSSGRRDRSEPFHDHAIFSDSTFSSSCASHGGSSCASQGGSSCSSGHGGAGCGG